MKLSSKYLKVMLLIAISVSCEAERLETREIMLGKKTITVEMADSPESRRSGLMNRKELGRDRGMLFIFEEEQKLSFWMKNTSIPLSIAYISKSGVIREIHDMTPFSQSPVYSSHSVLYALEVNRGWFEENGISVGDRLQLSP